MHLPFFIIGHGVFLKTIGDSGIVDEDRGVFCCSINKQLKDVEEFSCISTAKSYKCLGLFNFKLAFAKEDVLMNGMIDKLE